MTPVNKRSGFFNSFDGTRIYYEVRGEGPPIVFIYGIVCLINHWRYQLDYFANKNYQTIILDFRGHHFSEIPENKKNLSIDALAQDVICLCEHLQIEKALFAGHSFGNEVLLQTYLKKPELVIGAAFVSAFFSNPFNSIINHETLKEIFIYVKKAYNKAPHLTTKLWKAGITNPISVWLSSLVGGFNLKETSLHDIEIYSQGVANIDVRVFITLFEELTQHNSMDLLKEFNVPSLLLAGEKDSLTPSYMQQQIKNLLPECDLHIMPNASHCMQLDFPVTTNHLMEDFFKKIP